MRSEKYLAVLCNQRGMALLLSILILVAAAVVALSLGLDTSIETRIAGNQKVTAVAFFNAEAGLQKARVLLAQQFGTAPANFAKIRGGKQPDWGFLFPGGVTSVQVNLGSSAYQVSAINPGYPGGGAVSVITLRSIGYGPGGARQVVEESISAQANGSQSGYYAQQGGGSTKANSNARDKGTVNTDSNNNGGKVDMQGIRR